MSDFSGMSDCFGTSDEIGADSTLGTVLQYAAFLNPITLPSALFYTGVQEVFAPDDPNIVGQVADGAAHFAAPSDVTVAGKPLIPTWIKMALGMTAIGVIGISGVIVLTGVARKLHII